MITAATGLEQPPWAVGHVVRRNADASGGDDQGAIDRGLGTTGMGDRWGESSGEETVGEESDSDEQGCRPAEAQTAAPAGTLQRAASAPAGVGGGTSLCDRQCMGPGGCWGTRPAGLAATATVYVTETMSGVCPRLTGWLVHGGKRVRVSYLVDSGATDSFISPAVAQLVRAPVRSELGPSSLKTAGKERVQCRGVTEGVGMTVASTTHGTWSSDVNFVVAHIPDADVILGMTWCKRHKASLQWAEEEDGELLSIGVVGNGRSLVSLPVQGASRTPPGAVRSISSRDMRRVHPRRKKALAKLLQAGEAVRVDVFMAAADDALSDADTDNEVERVSEARADAPCGAGSSGGGDKAAAAVAAARAAPESYPEAVDITIAVIQEFADVFEAPTGIHRRAIEHSIETDNKRVPPSRRVPRFSLAELDAIRAWLKEMLACGWITPCHATHGAPLVLVRKPDGSFRCCQDYRMLNSVTRTSVAPMPLFDNLTATMVNAKVFSSIDLSSFYYQIAIRDEHRALTAFTTPFGNFCFNVTAMGLTGAPSTACMLLQELLRDFIGDNVATFIDDVCMFSMTMEAHRKLIWDVFGVLRANNLKVSLKKCAFARTELKFLGHIVGKDGIKVDPGRCRAIAQWPRPRDVAGVRSFLGVAGYYRKYVPNFSLVAAPLSSLLMLNSPFRKDPLSTWGPAQQTAFDTLKRALLQPPVLRIFDANLPTVVRTDASEWGMGAVLYQRVNGELHPVEYKSKRFTDTQMRYAPHDREFCAVLYAFRVWRHMLLNQRFLLETDNSAVSHIKNSKELSSKYARWLGLFEEMDCEVQHRPGHSMQLEDWLSRPPADQPDDDSGVLDPDADLVVFPGQDPLSIHAPPRAQCHTCAGEGYEGQWLQDDAFLGLRTQAGIVADTWQAPGPDGYTHLGPRSQASAQLYQIHAAGLADDSATDEEDNRRPTSTDDMDGSGILVQRFPRLDMSTWPGLYASSPEWRDRWNDGAGLPDQGFVVRNKVMYKAGGEQEWRLCVPLEARPLYLREIHSAPLAGHRGRRKTLAHARWLFWDSLVHDVQAFVRTCGECQRHKTVRMKEAGTAKALPVPPRPWHTFGMDWVGPLPRTAKGFDCILNIVCHLTGMVHFIPCKGSDTAEDVANHVFQEVVRLHGLPDVVVSDRDPKLTSKFWSSLCERIGTRLAMSCAYRPQTDGKVERSNAVMAEVLRCFVNARMDDWDTYLATAELAINSSVSDATGYTPFYVNYGFEPKLPWHTAAPAIDSESAFMLVEQLQSVHVFCRDALRRAKDKQTAYLSTKRRVVIYETGDRVLLATKNLRMRTPSHKLTARYVGPFEVLAVGENALELRLPAIMGIHPVVNVASVRPYYARSEALGGEDKATSIEIDGETQYIVEAVLGRKGPPAKPLYLVKWKGADMSEATWEPGANLPQWEVRLYENRYPRNGASADSQPPDPNSGIGVQKTAGERTGDQNKTAGTKRKSSLRLPTGAAAGGETQTGDPVKGTGLPTDGNKGSSLQEAVRARGGDDSTVAKTRRGGARKAKAKAERAKASSEGV